MVMKSKHSSIHPIAAYCQIRFLISIGRRGDGLKPSESGEVFDLELAMVDV